MSNLLFFKKNLLKKSSEDVQILEQPEVKSKKLVDNILTESEMRYRRLFETAKDGILIIDFETGKILDANPFIVNTIDLPRKEILGKELWEIGLFINKQQSELAFIDLKTNGYIRFEDMPIQRQNGTITEVEFVSNVYLENNKNVIQCNIRDITERKQSEIKLKENIKYIEEQNREKEKRAAELIIANKELTFQNEEKDRRAKEYSSLNQELSESINHIQNINEELIRAKQKAEESDKLKSAFLANMSHEIRTPMNAIIGFSGFLLQPELSKEKLDNFVQIINTSSMQLLSVISDIIDISKIESDQLTIDSELVNINNLLNELFVAYNNIVDLKNLNLYYSSDNPNELIQVKSDGNRIKQVLCNLLNNAIKFTKEGEIKFGYKIEENFIEFYVTDTGIGLAPENHALIFERFRQVETTNVREFRGNGLGLSISKALVEKMGGSIKVNSELGMGSTFSFTIPYTKGIENIISPAVTTKTNKYNWSGKTILIVEDELNNHAYIEELFSGKKAKLLHAWNGSEAVEQVKIRSDISLVLMDIKMPIMNGYEAVRLIKQIRPKLPVIAQTAYSQSHNKKEALGAGCDNYISKPINRNLLMDIVSSYLS